MDKLEVHTNAYLKNSLFSNEYISSIALGSLGQLDFFVSRFSEQNMARTFTNLTPCQEPVVHHWVDL